MKAIFYIILFFVVFILLTTINKYTGITKKEIFKPAGLNYIQKRMLNKCQVPTLTMAKCFENEYNECPKYNGSYKQCTNNYIPKPNTNNCECRNRTFEMCPEPYKISPKCYYKLLR